MEKQKKTGADSLYDIDYYKSLKGKDAMQQRLMGRLPIIDIAGHPFFADARIGLLRPLDNFSTMGINIADIPVDPETRTLSFYYHIPSMTQVAISGDATEYPKDVVMVTTPHRYGLDPVGMSYANDKDSKHFLVGRSPKMYLVAEITPLTQSPMAAVINSNIERLYDNRIAVQKNKTIVHKRKKGRGI